MMKRNILLAGIATLLVMLFLYASFSKYFDFAGFQRAMYRQPFPHGLSALLIVLLPPLEIAVSILLMMEKTRKKGLWGAALLMLLFTAYIAAILLHVFPKIPCSCGGVISRLNWQQHLVFNIFFLGLAITGLIIPHQPDDMNGGVKPRRNNISRAKSG